MRRQVAMSASAANRSGVAVPIISVTVAEIRVMGSAFPNEPASAGGRAALVPPSNVIVRRATEAEPGSATRGGRSAANGAEHGGGPWLARVEKATILADSCLAWTPGVTDDGIACLNP